MERHISVITAIILFLASASLIAGKNSNLEALSPQATVDPVTIEESFNPSANAAVYDNTGLFIPRVVQEYIAQGNQGKYILGASTEEKRIEIDLTNQRLYAYEGERKVFDFIVSTGKWGRTPTGVFKIWIKLRSTKMEGGSQELGTYYYLPNVPYVMYFYNDQIHKWRGYGIHGTYWHDNFGTPMSHGCINMRTEEVQQLYYWATPDLEGKSSIKATDENQGTTIVIYGTAPDS
jgi:lipoprotein-anchoring transpeptidase ErfK/SrfK